jgi:dihydrofolate synthase/folylpolyglutamate synthase
MNYQKTLAYIMDQLPMYQRLGKLAYRSGLDNTRQLDTFFQSPHRHFRTIHIAGTNGKDTKLDYIHRLTWLISGNGSK